MNFLADLFGKVPIVKNAKGENAICIDFANHLQRETRQERFNTVWFHVANEFAPEKDNKEKQKKKFSVFGCVLKAMGKLAGVADYIFLWGGGCGCIEFKTPTGKQSEAQKRFQAWCESCGVPYEIATSKEEGLDILKRWGRI